MTTYEDYITSFSKIDLKLAKKLQNMYYRINNNELPFNYILFKCLELCGYDSDFVPKIQNVDLINYYDTLWRQIAWKNDWLYKKSPEFVKTRINKTDKYSLYYKYYYEIIEISNIPVDVKNELIEYFPKVWSVYIRHFSSYKFVSADFMIRKLLQNMGQIKYLCEFKRRINDIDTLTKFEELWQYICNELEIINF